MKKIHIIWHEEYVAPGYIEIWLKQQQYKPQYFKIWKKSVFPAADQTDMLIIMGGTMNVDEENLYSWMIDEKKLIKSTINAGKPVLGICLGAQFIAEALGAKVTRSPYDEIGWHNVYLNQEFTNIIGLTSIPHKFKAFNWHSYQFELPDKSISLGYSKATPVQGFIYNKNIIGIQFHPEVTPRIIVDYLKNTDELIENKFFVQNKATIQNGTENLHQSHQLLGYILNYLINFT